MAFAIFKTCQNYKSKWIIFKGEESFQNVSTIICVNRIAFYLKVQFPS